jgi:hypothetical protein
MARPLVGGGRRLAEAGEELLRVASFHVPNPATGTEAESGRHLRVFVRAIRVPSIYGHPVFAYGGNQPRKLYRSLGVAIELCLSQGAARLLRH